MPRSIVRISDLAEIVPVFPLGGVILLPRAQLPLNIFEPRYLNMIDDAMAGDRLIAMVQTTGGSPLKPTLADVACVGRITSFSETTDSRYLITLTGVCRARLASEIPVSSPYRQCRLDYGPFEHDLTEEDGELEGFDRERLVAALSAYLRRRSLEIDWDTAEQAPPEPLINSLSIALPFEAASKQLLLESPSLLERAEALIAILEIDTAVDPDDGEPPSMQ
jgi:Lon protease-like protein